MRINQKGFTLIEMIIVMAVFMVVLIITGTSFKTILEQTSKVFRSEESNIEGVIGLEMLRHDLQQAGLGLFTEIAPVTYTGEAANAPASNYNDFDTAVGANNRKEPPRPIAVGQDLAAGLSDGTNKFVTGTDYLAIKATTVSRTKTSQKWTYLEFSPLGVTPHSWQSASENLVSDSPKDNVVLLRRQVSTSSVTTTLVSNPASTPNGYTYAFSNTAFAQFSSSGASVFTAYGIDNSEPRMPFNRTDYFVAVPSKNDGTPDPTRIPDVCAKDASGNPNPAVGILYKATVNQDDGALNPIPVMDCVADMQVVLGWDMNGDGSIDMYSNADGSVCSGGVACAAPVAAALSLANNASAATTPNIRNNLKLIKVYVLAQNGKRDPGYTSPSPIVVGDTAEASLTRSYNLAANGLLNYRWKLHRIVVRPKNFISNQ